MLTTILLCLTLATALYGSYIIFKELADVSQWVVQSERQKTMSTWYNRNKWAALTLGGLALSWLLWGAGSTVVPMGVMLTVSAVVALLFFSGFINPDLMMRARQEDGVFVSPAEAEAYYAADESVIVYEINGEARAHSDKQLLRPHVAGQGQVGGKPVVMTYCGLTNLGMAYVPEINGQPLALRPMTQLENNLVMVDDNTGEPVQQLWGRKESDVGSNQACEMPQVATFRMPFAQFRQAYPEGQVYLNDYLVQGMRTPFWKNPVKYSYDRVMELIFKVAIAFQKSSDKPVFPTLKHIDTRLPSKTLVWAFNVGDDYAAYTEVFVREQGGLVNCQVGGQDMVVSYDDTFDSLGVFRNTTGREVESLDFNGVTQDGVKLERVETLKAGVFWVVWANFFPQTRLNPVSGSHQ